MIIVDKLSLDSWIIILIFRIKGINNFYFCRSSYLGSFLLKILNKIVNVRPHDLVLNEVYNDGISLQDKRERLLDNILRHAKSPCVQKISKDLHVNEGKLINSWRISLWCEYFYAAEAYVVSEYLGGRPLLENVYNHKEIFDNPLTYYRLIDRSRIIPRLGYLFDTTYEVNSRFTVLPKHMSVIFSAVLFFLVSETRIVKPRVVKKKIGVHFLRKSQSLVGKSDYFWVDKLTDIDDTVIFSSIQFEHPDELKSVPIIDTRLRSALQLKRDSFIRLEGVSSKILSSVPVIIKLILNSFLHKELRGFVDYAITGIFYSHTFSSVGVGVFTSNHSYFNTSYVIAVNSCNAVYIRGTWSNQGYTNYHISSCADVFFAWGDENIDIYSRSGSKDITYVKVGFIDGKNLLPPQSLDDTCLRLKEFNDPDSFTIVFFDNIIGRDLSNSSRHLKDSINLILRLMDSHREVKLIYKAKRSIEKELTRLGLWKRLDKYVTEGRVLIVGNTTYSTISPSHTLPFSDFAIGFPISSALTEYWVAGGKGVCLNFSKLREHHLDLFHSNSLVYHDPDGAFLAIKSVIEGAGFGVGLPNTYVERVNFNRDYSSKERMSFYVRAMANRPLAEPIDMKINAVNLDYSAHDFSKKDTIVKI